MQLGPFHRLGTLTHGVKEGTWNKEIKIYYRVPETENMISKWIDDTYVHA